MPPKADPYNTPVHHRIDVVLFAVVFVIVAILLSTSAHAQRINSATNMRIVLDVEVATLATVHTPYDSSSRK